MAGRRSRWMAAAGGVVAIALTTLTGPASAEVLTQTVADGAAVSFTLRPSYDAGGADPLKLYAGYTAANVTTPEPEADGQASWYNLGILETGLFLPPASCTPEKNLQATLDGAQDLQAWLAGSLQAAVAAVQEGQVPGSPTVPGPRHPCAERFPGFAQSRYPATTTILEQESDNYVDKPTAAQACREDPSSPACVSYREYWPILRGTTGAAVQQGSFSTQSTDRPSQRSEALLLGAGDGTVVSIGMARTTSTARLEGGALVVEASSDLDDVCLAAADGVCALRIDHLRQHARVVKRAGSAAQRSAGTVVTGVHGTGLAQDLDAAALGLDALDLDLGGSLRLSAVSQSGGCGSGTTDPAVVLADAGGLLLSAKGAQGGSIMIGGACARARIERTSFDLGEAPAAGPVDPAVPGEAPAVEPPALVAPGAAPALGPEARVALGPVRTVSRTVTHYVLKEPLAWRTAPYWGVLFGLVVVVALACRFAPDNPVVAPAAGAVNRFARRFLRG